MGEVKKRINGNLIITEKTLLTGTINCRLLYRGCQKNVPIEDRFSATNLYTANIFSEHYYDMRYKYWLTPGYVQGTNIAFI